MESGNLKDRMLGAMKEADAAYHASSNVIALLCGEQDIAAESCTQIAKEYAINLADWMGKNVTPEEGGWFHHESFTRVSTPQLLELFKNAQKQVYNSKQTT